MSLTPHTKHIITPPILLHIPSTPLVRTPLSETLYEILRAPFFLRLRSQSIIFCTRHALVPWHAMVEARLALAGFAFHYR